MCKCGGVVAVEEEVFFIIILLRSWQLYTEAAIWTFGRHLLQHSSSIIQMQCLHEWSTYCARRVSWDCSNSGPNRGRLQLHLTAAREYCSNRPKNWELFQVTSQAAKTCSSLNWVLQNFKVCEQNCLLGSGKRKGNRKPETGGTINWLISFSLWSFYFWLHLNTFPRLLAPFWRNACKKSPAWSTFLRCSPWKFENHTGTLHPHEAQLSSPYTTGTLAQFNILLVTSTVSYCTDLRSFHCEGCIPEWDRHSLLFPLLF